MAKLNDLRSWQLGLVLHRYEVKRILGPGQHWTLWRTRVDIAIQRDTTLYRHDLDVLVQSGLLED